MCQGAAGCFNGSVGGAHQKVHVSLFRADSGTNLIKQVGNVKG